MPRRGRRRRNPEWSFSLLDEIWDGLRAVAGEELLPIPVKTNPRVEELGEGAWGVVMPTVNPRWSMKLTLDRDEAAYVNLADQLGVGEAFRGIVPTKLCFDTGLRIPRKGYAYPAYVYWRRRSSVMGVAVFDVLAENTRRARASDAFNHIHALVDADRFGSDDEYLAALEILGENPSLADASREMLALVNMGVTLRDAHLGNWGLLDDPKTLVLMDPGQADFTPEARADAFRFEALPAPARAR